MALHSASGRCPVRTEVAADAVKGSISCDVNKNCFGDTPDFYLSSVLTDGTADVVTQGANR